MTAKKFPHRTSYVLACFHFFFLLLVSSSTLHAQETFNKKLADSLGGDEYGMKRYVLVILKTGPANITDKKITDSLFRGHMENIGVLARAGKLAVAGPMQKNEKSYRGIFILNTTSLEEAKAMLDKDLAIKAGIFDVELYNWYGSAALPMYLPYHEKIERKKH